ncbi:hypothetical protein B0H15DRAFT_434119 [Mycena belliarum]|uniref:Uncharacterized protein n=1 Tax=Mycena belliarum TaxID=1033014 RepID=A0AAD6XN78_9AGAR|nr:hypothetical protein B0H15DRAFT_434119 [Mycena belliae]
MALQDREAALKCIKSSFVRTTKSDRFRMFTFPPLPQDAWTSVEKFETLTCQGRKIYKSLINSCLSDPIFDEDKTLLLEGFNCPILLKRFVKETDSLDLASCPFTGLNASESLFVYLGRYSTCEFAWIRLKGCFISIVPSMTKYALKRLQAKRRKDLSVSNPPRTSKVQSREWRKCSKNITSAERRNITTLGVVNSNRRDKQQPGNNIHAVARMLDSCSKVELSGHILMFTGGDHPLPEKAGCEGAEEEVGRQIFEGT